MTVAVAHDAHPLTVRQRVTEQPLERAPGGVHLDRTLHPVVKAYVGVAPADVGNEQCRPAAQRREQAGDVGAVRMAVGIIDQGMAAAVDLLSLAQVQHVAVTAQRRVAGPLVPRKHHEPSRFIRLSGEPLQVLPELTRDLEVVALVDGKVQAGQVAGEAEVLLRRARADRLLGLAVQVAPPAAPPEARLDHHGVAAEGNAGPRALRLEGDRQVARFVDRQPVQADGAPPASDLGPYRAVRAPDGSAAGGSGPAPRPWGCPSDPPPLPADGTALPGVPAVGSSARQRTGGPGTIATVRTPSTC